MSDHNKVENHKSVLAYFVIIKMAGKRLELLFQCVSSKVSAVIAPDNNSAISDENFGHKKHVEKKKQN